ncbi:hypothetical protein [Azotosporobacter soli]|uniref:hypothetical protein n=1 Tax=Azotosporobacter soli TaxID=3055040 RepID=UPI0031FEFA3E
MKTKLFSLIAGLLLFLLPVSCQAADYSNYLTVNEVQLITGLSDLTLKSIDAKKSGEAADLTYLTANGLPVMMVQILNGSDYERYYSDLRCQDYRAMDYAFWGPKDATPDNPPTLLAFRKNDVLIVIGSGLNADNQPFLKNYMFEKAANLIASRL